VDRIAALVEGGYGDRILMSHDSMTINVMAVNGVPGLVRIPDVVVPIMREKRPHLVSDPRNHGDQSGAGTEPRMKAEPTQGENGSRIIVRNRPNGSQAHQWYTREELACL
jgi:hypothetical protein